MTILDVVSSEGTTIELVDNTVTLDVTHVAGVTLEVGETVAEIIGAAAVGPPGPRGITGPAGADGADGAPGPQGAPGLDGGAYRHVQGVPSAVWTITHNLGFNPGGIAVVDSSGSLHDGFVEYVDSNTIRISFFVAGAPAAFSGEAYIS